MSNSQRQVRNQPEVSDRQPKKLYLIWWVLGTLVQIAACLPWVYKQIHWRALVLTSLILVLIMFGIESLALYGRWWIWDESKLLGPKVWLIPLEEFLLYWLVVPSLVTIQMLFLKGIQYFYSFINRRDLVIKQ